jgi:hypothetical protein
MSHNKETTAKAKQGREVGNSELFSGEISTPIDTESQISSDISNAMAIDLEIVVRQRIKDVLGGDFNLPDIESRLGLLRKHGSSVEVLTLDGKPILQIHPIELKTVEEGLTVKVVATQKTMKL